MSDILKHLKEHNVKFVRIIWCDNANIIRAKSVHINYLKDALSSGVKMAEAQMALPVMYDAVVPDAGLTPVGEVTLVPDINTLKVLPFTKGQASMICDMKTLGVLEPWEHCPREYLKKQIAKLETTGFSLKAVFENEFYLLRKDEQGNIVKSDESSFAMTSSANTNSEFLLDLEDAFEKQNLKVESYYSESGPGQHEFNIRYSDALHCADNQITYRETVRGVATKHQFIASFMPKIFENCGGSGTHLNFSLWKDGANVSGSKKSETGLSEVFSQFIAGILHHLKALCAITIPSVNSYRRVIPHYWAGAYVSWGHYNREAAIRVSKNNAQTKVQRVELKVSDASANPYLALGALMACGIDGIEKKMKLPDETTIDPAYVPTQQCKAKGIEPLPKNLAEALAHLAEDDLLLDSMGEGLAKSFFEVRKFEWDNLKDVGLKEEVKIMLEKY